MSLGRTGKEKDCSLSAAVEDILVFEWLYGHMGSSSTVLCTLL